MQTTAALNATAMGLHTVQAIFLLLMVFIALFSGLARRLHAPYPIVLVLGGLLLSFVPHMPQVRLEPETFFFLLLPPLLYAAAWQTSWRDFRRNLISISMLALGLVGFTVLGVAFTADHFIRALDWKTGFLLGAIVSPTDALAATTIARTLGLPRKIVDVLEGESLVNDATGLLALEFGLALLLRGEAPSITGGALRLLWLSGGGVAIGLLVGALIVWCERWIHEASIEIVLSLIVPYGAYLAAEEANASGVLAVVACGLWVSRRSSTFFSPETRLQALSVWGALNFVLNGIVFILIGLQLPYVLAGIRGYSVWALIGMGATFSALLILLRLIWVYPESWIARHLGARLRKEAVEPFRPRETFVIGWTGMRGAVSLAAVLSLPVTLGDGTPFAQRNLLIFLTFSVILVTLVLQGLTLPPLIRALGLAGLGNDRGEEVEARKLALQSAIQCLTDNRDQVEGHERHAYQDLLHQYQHRLESVEGSEKQDHMLRIELDAAQAERRTLLSLRDEGRISDETLRTLERELDLTETRFGSRLPE